jgi:plasmid stability protein
MAQILVRNLNKAVVEHLKSRARRGGRSLQSEVRAILQQAAETDLAAAGRLASRIRRSFNGRRFGDSVALIRQDRDR